LFTDGYADQFGGEKGKKFKYKQLEELLVANSSKELEEQKQILLNTFDAWKGDLEQVDDVTIIGIKL
jgi:serine phosphatase RsbU (regulator of sigma subunit)